VTIGVDQSHVRWRLHEIKRRLGRMNHACEDELDLDLCWHEFRSAGDNPGPRRPISLGDRSLSAKHAIPGLVIEQPSYAWRIAVEVCRHLRFADLADSYPYWALDKLKAEGLVRQVYENDIPAGKSIAAGGQAIYEATEKGVQAFEDWLRAGPDEYSFRDDLQFRLAVARPLDVPTIVRLIRDREYVRVAREQTLEQFQPAKEDFACNSAIRDVARGAEPMFWRGRIAWLRGVREMLEARSAEVAVCASRRGPKS
jgi:DNA-binding PadR family transcriptional regulator